MANVACFSGCKSGNSGHCEICNSNKECPWSECRTSPCGGDTSRRLCHLQWIESDNRRQADQQWHCYVRSYHVLVRDLATAEEGVVSETFALALFITGDSFAILVIYNNCSENNESNTCMWVRM